MRSEHLKNKYKEKRKLIMMSHIASNTLVILIYIYIYLSTAMQKPVLWYILGKILFTYFQYPYSLMLAFPNYFCKIIIISITTGKFVNWSFGVAASL